MASSASAPSVAPKPVAPAAPAATAAPKPALTKAPPVPIGITSEGTPVYAPFQPTVTSIALALTPCLTDPAADLSSVSPLPKGPALQRSPEGTQIQLKVEPFFASKLRRVFGYVGEITLTGGDGTDTPAQLQVITRIPWKFGRTAAESGCSWMYVRVQAFACKAVFASGAKVVKLGSCISGFSEPSSGPAKS